MIDGEGYLAETDDAKRTQAVENHYKWVEAAKYLGCHSIRVNIPPIESLRAQKSLILYHPKKQAEDYDEIQQVGKYRPSGGNLSFVKPHKNGAFIVFRDMDLSKVSSIIYRTQSSGASNISLSLDSPNGKVVQEIEIKPSRNMEEWLSTKSDVSSDGKIHDLYFVFQGDFEQEGNALHLDWVLFQQ